VAYWTRFGAVASVVHRCVYIILFWNIAYE